MKYFFTLLIFLLTIVSCGHNNSVHKHIENDINNTKIISDSTNKLTNKIEELEVEYTVWGCACPNWIETKNNKNNATTKNYINLHFYIEPAKKSLELPKSFDASIHKLILKGQFYENEDYPQGTIESEEPMQKARVFSYSKIELIKKEKK